MADEKITGFDMISTALYRGWTPSIISEIYRIIQSFYKLPVAQALLKFREDVIRHVRFGPNDHNWDISPWTDQLMTQLYTKFRDLGFDGTKAEMLEKILKDIEVGSHTDTKEGYREDLAISVPDWQFLWNKHLKSLNAHPNLRKIFQSDDPPETSPTVYYSNLFNIDDEKLKEERDFPEWKDTEGAIAFKFVYHFQDEEAHDKELFSIWSDDFDLTVRYTWDGSLICTLRVELMKVGYEGIVRQLDLPFGPNMRVSSLITYGDDQLIVRDAFGEDQVEFVHKAAPASIAITAPITQFGTGLCEWMYYPEYMSARQRLFFIN